MPLQRRRACAARLTVGSGTRLRVPGARDPPRGALTYPDSFLSFAAARLRDERLGLRPATPEDLPLLASIYAYTRIEELRPVPWSDAQKKAFTDWQSAQQEQHYALHYPNAERLLIERMAAPGTFAATIGRIYADTATAEVRLMEITLLPRFRNLGLGTRIVESLLDYADQKGLSVTLHVEPFNPAKRMYERMGFVVLETRGIYDFMRRR